MAYIEEGGRRLLVEFTCGRCGTKALKPYEHSDNFSVGSNMRNNKLPNGWRVKLDGLPMLCDGCTAALEEFMKGSDKDANSND